MGPTSPKAAKRIDYGRTNLYDNAFDLKRQPANMYLPTTQKEMTALGWQQPDIILVTGDAYIDSPFIGVAVIGKVLAEQGFKVGIIAQPDTQSESDITRLGEPRLFWGVTAGSIDSMVANYTALKKKRKSDDFTPGGLNTKRPDRAVIAYTNLIRRYFKSTAPVVLGGIEASLRRIAHFDFWSNHVRRSVLLDAKADFLLFGMAHKNIIALARALDTQTSIRDIGGLCYMAAEKKGIELPGFDRVKKDKNAYAQSFKTFYQNMDPLTARALSQKYDNRYLVLNPAPAQSTTKELDHIHALGYERDVHPFYKAQGPVKAVETIRYSIPVHYGCYGECNFCAISVHQGRTVSWRSPASVVKEAKTIAALPDFKGYITDLGGPTANMYGFECSKKIKKGACPDKRCLFPKVCPSLKPDHSRYLDLIRAIESIPEVKKVFISSGIRTDLILNDRKNGMAFLKKITRDNVSGQMKIAPEHTQDKVLALMGKQSAEHLLAFKSHFDRLSASFGKKQFLTYYLIAAHPGCSAGDMAKLKRFATQKLKTSPEQVQIFTPTPSTYSTLMYYTGKNPFTDESIFVEKNPKQKEKQKKIVTQKIFAGRNKKVRHKKSHHRSITKQ